MQNVTTQEQFQRKDVTVAFYAWLVCGLGALFYCYEYLLRIAPSVMTKDLMGAYHIQATALGNLVGFYYYIYTPMQLPVGVLMDRYGPRRLLAFACLICALGTYLFAFSDSYAIAVLGRFLVGLGSAFAFVGVLKLATIWLPPHRFAMIAGLTNTLGMMGGMVGDNFLVHLLQEQNWRIILTFLALFGVLLTVLIWFIIRDHNPMQQHSFSKLFRGLLMLVRQPKIWLPALIGLALYLPTSVFAELWGIPYLENARNVSSVDATRVISFIFLGWVVGGPVIGWLSDRINNRKWPIILGSISATALISAVLYLQHLSTNEISWLLFLFGVCSSAQPIVFALAREASPAILSGTAIAFTNMIVMIGGVIFQPIVGAILDAHWSGQIANGIRIYSAADFQIALIVLPLSVFAGVILGLMIDEKNR